MGKTQFLFWKPTKQRNRCLNSLIFAVSAAENQCLPSYQYAGSTCHAIDFTLVEKDEGVKQRDPQGSRFSPVGLISPVLHESSCLNGKVADILCLNLSPITIH